MSDITNEAGGDDVMRLRGRAFGIARDVARAFATDRSDGASTSALLEQLANELLREPELIKAIAAWHAAALHQVDGAEPQAVQPSVADRLRVLGNEKYAQSKSHDDEARSELVAVAEALWAVADEFEGEPTPPTEPVLAETASKDDYPYEVECSQCGAGKLIERGNHHPWCHCGSDVFRWGHERKPAPQAEPAWENASASERTHARRLLDRHCSLELRATLSAHQEEWWRLNREREASEADILQVLAAGLSASRVEPDRRPKSGMVLSHGGHRSTGLGPVVIDATARWAGAHQDVLGTWEFSEENWQKFVDALSEPQPGERA